MNKICKEEGEKRKVSRLERLERVLEGATKERDLQDKTLDMLEKEEAFQQQSFGSTGKNGSLPGAFYSTINGSFKMFNFYNATRLNS